MADHLVYVLGYEGSNEASKLVFMVSYHESRPGLLAFIKLAEPELLVIKCDSAAEHPLPESAGCVLSSVTLYYNVYIGIQLLTHCTNGRLLQVIRPRVELSFGSVEEAATRLDILKPDSQGRNLWEATKKTVIQYIDSQGDAMNSDDVGECIELVVDSIGKELASESKVPFLVCRVFLYLQHVQAIGRRAYDGNLFVSEHFSTMRMNVVSMPRDCFSNEFIQSLDRVCSLMATVERRESAVTIGELEQLLASLRWQAENFFDHFKPEGLDDSAVLGTEPPVTEEERVRHLRTALDAMRRTLNALQYRDFTEAVHLVASDLVANEGTDVLGQIQISVIQSMVGEENLSLSLGVFHALGYSPSIDYSQLLLRDYSRNASVLIAAVDISAEDLIIGKGDPGRLMPIEATDGPGVVVAHLSYHLWLRCALLAMSTPSRLLWSVEPEVSAALSDVDRLTRALGGPVQSIEDSKRRVATYMSTGAKMDREDLYTTLCQLQDEIVKCLRSMRRDFFIRLLSYCKIIYDVIVAAIKRPLAISVGFGADYYLSTVRLLDGSSLSSEFMTVQETISKLMDQSKSEHLSDSDVSRVYALSVWQSENWLSHLRPQSSFESMALLSMLRSRWSNEDFDCGTESPEDSSLDSSCPSPNPEVETQTDLPSDPSTSHIHDQGLHLHHPSVSETVEDTVSVSTTASQTKGNKVGQLPAAIEQSTERLERCLTSPCVFDEGVGTSSCGSNSTSKNPEELTVGNADVMFDGILSAIKAGESREAVIQMTEQLRHPWAVEIATSRVLAVLFCRTAQLHSIRRDLRRLEEGWKIMRSVSAAVDRALLDAKAQKLRELIRASKELDTLLEIERILRKRSIWQLPGKQTELEQSPVC